MERPNLRCGLSISCLTLRFSYLLATKPHAKKKFSTSYPPLQAKLVDNSLSVNAQEVLQ